MRKLRKNFEKSPKRQIWSADQQIFEFSRLKIYAFLSGFIKNPAIPAFPAMTNFNFYYLNFWM